ncbi:MAG: DUF2203 domain-containing protein [Verrucomicrobiota bacterium]
MSFQFSKHYTIEEARSLLPDLRTWLEDISKIRERMAKLDLRLTNLGSAGNDVGGDTVNSSVKLRADLLSVIQEFAARGIQIKDLERGLIDFPAVRNGREIFLCWEKDEEDIQYWHDLESGFSGREPLD